MQDRRKDKVRWEGESVKVREGKVSIGKVGVWRVRGGKDGRVRGEGRVHHFR